MRYIDKTGCKSGFEKGADKEIESLGKLTKKLARLPKKTSWEFLRQDRVLTESSKKAALVHTRISLQTLQRLMRF
ncbi:hypothetical protein [Cellulosilyticum ruminicola]|uniref:hypothetical protein n=1 Tax=Cellulosilyticum ruminicola TaxID=425254 RepID=UPI0006CF3BED|nr:hypothetical protein [Cellulosilyticum ruminicola]